MKFVRVTKRVHEAYFAELHLAKVSYLANCGETAEYMVFMLNRMRN